MRHSLTIAVLMVGMAAGAFAQNRPGSQDAASASAQSTDNNKQQKDTPRNKSTHEADCKADQQKDAQRHKDSCSDCKEPKQGESDDQSEANTIEYRG